MYANRWNFRVCQEIWVEEHDGDVYFRPEVERLPFRPGALKIMQWCLLIDEWPKFPHPVAFLLTTNCNF